MFSLSLETIKCFKFFKIFTYSLYIQYTYICNIVSSQEPEQHEYKIEGNLSNLYSEDLSRTTPLLSEILSYPSYIKKSIDMEENSSEHERKLLDRETYIPNQKRIADDSFEEYTPLKKSKFEEKNMIDSDINCDKKNISGNYVERYLHDGSDKDLTTSINIDAKEDVKMNNCLCNGIENNRNVEKITVENYTSCDNILCKLEKETLSYSHCTCRVNDIDVLQFKDHREESIQNSESIQYRDSYSIHKNIVKEESKDIESQSSNVYEKNEKHNELIAKNFIDKDLTTPQSITIDTDSFLLNVFNKFKINNVLDQEEISRLINVEIFNSRNIIHGNDSYQQQNHYTDYIFLGFCHIKTKQKEINTENKNKNILANINIIYLNTKTGGNLHEILHIFGCSSENIPVFKLIIERKNYIPKDCAFICSYKFDKHDRQDLINNIHEKYKSCIYFYCYYQYLLQNIYFYQILNNDYFPRKKTRLFYPIYVNCNTKMTINELALDNSYNVTSFKHQNSQSGYTFEINVIRIKNSYNSDNKIDYNISKNYRLPLHLLYSYLINIPNFNNVNYFVKIDKYLTISFLFVDSISNMTTLNEDDNSPYDKISLIKHLYHKIKTIQIDDIHFFIFIPAEFLQYKQSKLSYLCIKDDDYIFDDLNKYNDEVKNLGLLFFLDQIQKFKVTTCFNKKDKDDIYRELEHVEYTCLKDILVYRNISKFSCLRNSTIISQKINTQATDINKITRIILHKNEKILELIGYFHENGAPTYNIEIKEHSIHITETKTNNNYTIFFKTEKENKGIEYRYIDLKDIRELLLAENEFYRVQELSKFIIYIIHNKSTFEVHKNGSYIVNCDFQTFKRIVDNCSEY